MVNGRIESLISSHTARRRLAVCEEFRVLLLLNAIRYTLYAMNWIRAHRYAVALIAMAVLVVGGLMARNGSPETTAGRGDIRNVSVEYPYYAPPIAEFNGATAAGNSLQNPIQNASGSAPFILHFGTTQPKEDFPARTVPPVIPKVAESAPARTPNPSLPSLNDSYLSFFQALSRILSPTDTRTPEQKALYDYGNALGSTIRNFENTHMDVVQTLKIFFDSRTDPTKAAGIPKIAGVYAQLTAASSGTNPAVSAAQAGANLQIAANDYAQLSATVTGLQHIPPEATDLNTKLAKGYANVAEGFSRLIKSENDAQLLDAITAYNAGVDEFIKNYVALVKLFSAYGVKFSASDAGVIFSFSSAGGL